MNWIQKWFYRPIYLILNGIAIITVAIIIAGAISTVYNGYGWDYFITEFRYIIHVQVYCYFIGYYIKREYVDGPPTKEKLNAGK